MFSIKTQSRIPIFEQLKKQILEYISAGVLHGDDQLPSVRMLASSLGINPNTVAKNESSTRYRERAASSVLITSRCLSGKRSWHSSMTVSAT